MEYRLILLLRANARGALKSSQCSSIIPKIQGVPEIECPEKSTECDMECDVEGQYQSLGDTTIFLLCRLTKFLDPQ